MRAGSRPPIAPLECRDLRDTAPSRPGRGRGGDGTLLAPFAPTRASARSTWPQPQPCAREGGRGRRKLYCHCGNHHGGWMLTQSYACRMSGGWQDDWQSGSGELS